MDSESDKETFQTVVLRAMKDHQSKAEVEYHRKELELCREKNKSFQTELRSLQETLDANVEDCNRVIQSQENTLRTRLGEIQTLEQRVARIQEESATKHMALFRQKEQDRRLYLSQIDDLQKQLAQMAHFQHVKVQLDATIAQLQADKDMMKSRHEEQVMQLQHQYSLAQRRWQTEKKLVMTHNHLEMQERVSSEIDIQTRETMHENKRVHLEMSYQSNQVGQILEANERLQKENQQYRVQLALHEEAFESTAAQIQFYERMIKQLQGKRQQGEERLIMSTPPAEPRKRNPPERMKRERHSSSSGSSSSSSQSILKQAQIEIFQSIE